MATATSYTSDKIDELYSTQATQIAAVDDATIETAGIDAGGNLTLTRKDTSTIEAGSVGSTPPGSIVMYAGMTAPSGWLLCNGAAVSRTTYATLWNLLGTTYGPGNGSTTFNLPDLTQRFARIDSSAMGANGGGGSHTHALTLNAHDHSVAGGSIPAIARARVLTGSPERMSTQQIGDGVSNWTADHQFTANNAAVVSDGGIGQGIAVVGRTADQTGTGTAAAATPLPAYLNVNAIIKT
jgi:microcystin-dependent protein